MRGAAVAEEEPVAASGAECAALMQEGTEGSDAGAGADHDDGRGGIGGETEFFVGLNVDGDAGAQRCAFAEHGGADAAAIAIVRVVADDGDGGVEFAAVERGAGRNGVEARGELGKDIDELRG